jgi:hypothetical protein
LTLTNLTVASIRLWTETLPAEPGPARAALWGEHPIDEAPARFVDSPQAAELEAEQQKRKPGAMIAKNQSSEPKYVTRDGPRVKTVCLQVAVTESHLQNAVREAFDLAKSAGREPEEILSLWL